MAVVKKSIYGSVVVLLAFFTILIVSTPLLGTPDNYVLTGVATLFLYMVGLTNAKYRQYYKYVLFFAGYVFLSSFYRFEGISDRAWGNSMHEFSFLLMFILLIMMKHSITYKQEKILYWLFIAIITINVIDNIVLSILYPHLNEYRELMDDNVLNTINAGGSTFYTFALLFFILVFFIYLNATEKKVKHVMLIVAIIDAIYILGYCNKGSVVAFAIISFFLLLVSKRSSNPGVFITFSLLVFGLFFLFTIIFKQEIVDFISSNVSSNRLATRLITLVDSKNSNAEQVTISGREDLYFLSLKTWSSGVSNFFFGVGDVRTANNIEMTGVGQHADLLDSLARYGIIGSFLIFGCIWYALKGILKLFNKSLSLQLKIVFLIFVLCGCTKTIFVPEVGCIMFVLLPLSARLVNTH